MSSLGGARLEDNMSYDEFGERKPTDDKGEKFTLRHKLELFSTISGPGSILKVEAPSTFSKDSDVDTENRSADHVKQAHDRTAEICGSLQTVRIVNARLTEDETGRKVVDEQTATRYKSKQSWHLGKWMCCKAGRTFTDEKYLNSLTPLYLQQVHLV